MDTLLQDLRSTLQTLSGYPAFTVAAAMSLGLGLQNGPPQRLPRPDRRVVRAAHVVAPPHRTLSWMDYIDFRRGSGDVLRWIAPNTLTDQPAHLDHPRTCGASE